MNQTGLMTRTDAADRPAAATIAGQRLELLDRARVYACGITPYDVTHLGHASTFVWIDALGRTLRFLGVEPEVCRNVTDVDDVLDAAARRAGAAYDEFAAIQQFQFDRDMAALGVRAPAHEPRAHRYVEQVIRLASGLLDAGAAYAREGSVYFRGQGVTSRVGLDRAEALRLSGEYGGRPDDPAKDDPLDVAVWQASETGHPAWESPWGQNWDYRPALLEAATTRLDTLYQAAAQNAPNDPAAVDALRRLLADDLNVPAAVDLAIEAGGAAARTLVSVLGLS